MYSIASPTQARSKKALERFLNVAAELLANNQFEETGISQIAQLAESSVGTFYRLLGDKDVLLYAVHQHFVEQSRTAVDSLVADLTRQPLPLDAQVEAFIRGVVRLFDGSEGLLRALIRRSSMDPQFRQRFHQLNAHIGQAFASIVLSHRDSLQHPAPEQAADLSAHMLLSGLNYLTMVGSLGTTPGNISRENFRDWSAITITDCP